MASVEDQSKETPEPASSPGSEPAPDVRADTPAPAESSPAKDEERKSLLDVVKDALDIKEVEDEDAPIVAASKEASSPSEGVEAKSKPDSKPDTKDDVGDDALLAALDKLKTDVPLNKIERFREVIAENRQLKAGQERYKQLDSTFTEIGRDAMRMGMSQDQVAQLFAWPRLLASDPKAAVEQLQGFAAEWQEKVGHSLPPDLKQKVDDGILDEPTAKEVAQLRASTVLDRTRREVDEREQSRVGLATRQEEIKSAVNQYQVELKANDPDYTPEKHEMTVDALTALVSKHGLPATVADARAMAKAAYDTVTKRLSAFKPQPRAISSPSVGRRLNKPAEAQPKSMREAIENALGG